MSVIRLAIISDDPGRGGAYKVAADIAQGLDRDKYEVKWFFLCKQPQKGPEGHYLGSPSINIDYSLKSYLRLAFFPKNNETKFAPLNEALSVYEPDLIHFHTHPIFLSLVKSLQNNPYFTKTKFIYTDHLQRLRFAKFLSIQVWLMALVYKNLFKNFYTVFISKYAYKTAVMLKFAKSKKDALIENSVDVQKFSPLNNEQRDTLKVVYLARLHPVKGHQILLDAWKHLDKRSDMSLHLYGQDDDGRSIRISIEQNHYPNPVYYHGVTMKPENVLQNADIGVFPSNREGMPLALLEMMACGLPVVASDIPEIKSIITHGKDGLLFDCGNQDDMAEKVEQLLQDENMRRRIGDEARKLVLKKYSQSISEKYHQFYQSIIKL